jgi:hypothetical protein
MIRRKKRFRWTKALYRERNQVERFFNKLKRSCGLRHGTTSSASLSWPSSNSQPCEFRPA